MNRRSNPNSRSCLWFECADLDGISRTATQILSAVQTTIAVHGATQVTLVGHSLGTFSSKLNLKWLTYLAPSCIGAAIALLDGVYLPLHISGVSFKVIVYGMPRVCASASFVNLDWYFILVQVGNQAFADYLDANLSVIHVNNKSALPPTTFFFSGWSNDSDTL